jgi:hypothetical protein
MVAQVQIKLSFPADAQLTPYVEQLLVENHKHKQKAETRGKEEANILLLSRDCC